MAGPLQYQPPALPTYFPSHPYPFKPNIEEGETPLLLTLPHDILLCICDFLDPASMAFFALTNKAIVGILGTICFKLRGNDRIIFLRILEPDFPDLLLCRHCPKFTLCNKRKSADFGFIDHRCFVLLGRFDFGVSGYSLLVSDVQQILNRHQFGPEFGFSVDAIEFRETGDRFPAPNAEYIRARIWADRLYLRVDTRTRFVRDDEDMKKTVIHRRRRFCGVVGDNNLNYISFQEFGTPFVRCSACLSEFRIKISRANEVEDTLCTTAWYKLGSVDNYFQTHWLRITFYTDDMEPEGISEKQAVYRRAFQRGLEKGKKVGV